MEKRRFSSHHRWQRGKLYREEKGETRRNQVKDSLLQCWNNLKKMKRDERNGGTADERRTLLAPFQTRRFRWIENMINGVQFVTEVKMNEKKKNTDENANIQKERMIAIGRFIHGSRLLDLDFSSMFRFFLLLVRTSFYRRQISLRLIIFDTPY